MTQDEIIEMARQAGMCGLVEGGLIKEFEIFAKLVADKKDLEHKEAMRWDVHTCGPTCKRYACVATREAVKAEREAIWEMACDYTQRYNSHVCLALADEIRARGEA